MYDIIHNSYLTQTRRHSGLPPRTQSKHSAVRKTNPEASDGAVLRRSNSQLSPELHMYDVIHNSYPTQTRRHSGLPPRTQSKHSDNAVNALYLSVRTQAATKKYISAALDRLNHFDLRRVKPQSLAPPSASVQARNVTRLRFEFQGARARRHRRRRWRAPAGSRPGARRSLASSMVKGRELRGLYGTKRLVNFLSSRM